MFSNNSVIKIIYYYKLDRENQYFIQSCCFVLFFSREKGFENRIESFKQLPMTEVHVKTINIYKLFNELGKKDDSVSVLPQLAK